MFGQVMASECCVKTEMSPERYLATLADGIVE